MNRWIAPYAVCLLMLLASQVVHAQEKSEGESDTKATEAEKTEKEFADLLEKTAKGPMAVSNIKKDDKGRIVSCLVVGRSAIPSSLGVAKGTEVAEKRASIAAKGEFTKWLGEDVSVEESQDGEVVTITEGEKENSKSIDKNSGKFKSIADSLVRGLQVAYYEQNGEEKTYTIVYKFNAKTADAVKKVKTGLNKTDSKTPADKSKSTADKGEKPKESSEEKPKSGSIPSKKGVILNNDD